ncbi:MAG TPA: SDR family oxidoreductase [Candidatus Baltobacteraceae bacterium]|nr:SDR family oxidoreductase [Candidatus Baltobacteraceae bacterium]
MEKATVITGAGRGIGRAAALRLAGGGPLVLVGLTQAHLDAVANDILARDGKAIAVSGDVADPATSARAVEAAHAEGWTVGALVASAGIGKGGPTHEILEEDWKRLFDVNVHGAFHFVRAVLPDMLAAGQGAICLVSSTAGVKGYAYAAGYSATKHALVGLARSMAKEYGKRGIVTVPICPGFVDTDMARHTIEGLMKHRGIGEAEAREKIARVNPQRRILPPEEVAEAIAFVLSGNVPALSGEPMILGGGE